MIPPVLLPPYISNVRYTENAPLDARDPKKCKLDLKRVRLDVATRVKRTARRYAKDWCIAQNRSEENGVDLEQLSEDADRFAEDQVQLVSPLIEAAMDSVTADDVTPDEYREAETERLFDAVESAEERLGVAQIESLNLDLVRQSAKIDLASGVITEQNAQNLVRMSDAQIAAELGCSAEEWSSHLLATFNERYHTSFGSLGEIECAGIEVHIDEIVGCCNWGLDELRYCFHWRNSQLLKAVENLRKTRYASPQEKQAKKDEIDGVL